jgi:hypothetical protein
LIQIKDARAGAVTVSLLETERHMPTETIVIVSAIVGAFFVFGAALYWAERRTRNFRSH